MVKRNSCYLIQIIIMFICLFILFSSVQSAKIPVGANLNITFKFKDNSNQLRNKKGGGCCPYKILEDGYHETIWIEGPFDPKTPCQIVNYQRTNASIKLTKVISFYADGWDRPQLVIKPNPWGYGDYDTPDFLAALMRAGMYYYCPDMTVVTEADVCTNPILAPIDSRRQDPTKGGHYCGPNFFDVTTICHTLPGCNGTCKPANGNIKKVVDGVSSATRYPALDPSPVSFDWDMRDYNGNLIQEGYYVAYVQMSAERGPRTLEYGHLDIDSNLVIGMESCWDDPAYDSVGNHRVVEAFYFKDSSFTRVVSKEKKWSGDQYNYMTGNMTFAYTAPSVSITGKNTSYEVSDNIEISLLSHGSESIIHITLSAQSISTSNLVFSLFDLQGNQLMHLPLPADGKIKIDKTSLRTGIYFINIQLADYHYTTRLFISL